MRTALHLGALAACGQNGVNLARIRSECMLMHFIPSSLVLCILYICVHL